MAGTYAIVLLFNFPSIKLRPDKYNTWSTIWKWAKRMPDIIVAITIVCRKLKSSKTLKSRNLKSILNFIIFYPIPAWTFEFVNFITNFNSTFYADWSTRQAAHSHTTLLGTSPPNAPIPCMQDYHQSQYIPMPLIAETILCAFCVIIFLKFNKVMLKIKLNKFI